MNSKIDIPNTHKINILRILHQILMRAKQILYVVFTI